MAPLIPVSISSNINVGILSLSTKTHFNASIILDNSPPDNTFSSGFSGSPGFAEIKNWTSSYPLLLASSLKFTSILIIAFSSPTYDNSSLILTSKSLADMHLNSCSFKPISFISFSITLNSFFNFSIISSELINSSYWFLSFSKNWRISSMELPYFFLYKLISYILSFIAASSFSS